MISPGVTAALSSGKESPLAIAMPRPSVIGLSTIRCATLRMPAEFERFVEASSAMVSHSAHSIMPLRSKSRAMAKARSCCSVTSATAPPRRSFSPWTNSWKLRQPSRSSSRVRKSSLQRTPLGRVSGSGDASEHAVRASLWASLMAGRRITSANRCGACPERVPSPAFSSVTTPLVEFLIQSVVSASLQDSRFSSSSTRSCLTRSLA
mmetsp:Transcript_23300/g.69384  ORF Transcript_23300/g.69384 Transcript_23300/m.69384 type:complete len:207 (-) Transcript_23300:123-743(-)